jgi:hypothetical protein
LALYNTSTSPDDRRLLALLVRPIPLLGARVAGRLWGTGMGLGVDEAARRVRTTASPSTSTPTSPQPVLRALQEGVAVERLRTVASRAFARAVLNTTSEGEDNERATEEREQALAAARALSGRVGALGARVGRVLGGGTLDALDMLNPPADDEGDDDAAADVEKLLCALVLYRRVFPSSTSVDAGVDVAADKHALRRTLGSSEVFEDALVEEARDRVVDLLTGQQ